MPGVYGDPIHARRTSGWRLCVARPACHCRILKYLRFVSPPRSSSGGGIKAIPGFNDSRVNFTVEGSSAAKKRAFLTFLALSWEDRSVSTILGQNVDIDHEISEALVLSFSRTSHWKSLSPSSLGHVGLPGLLCQWLTILCRLTYRSMRYAGAFCVAIDSLRHSLPLYHA